MNIYGFDRPTMFDEPERRQLELFAGARRRHPACSSAQRLTRDDALLARAVT